MFSKKANNIFLKKIYKITINANTSQHLDYIMFTDGILKMNIFYPKTKRMLFNFLIFIYITNRLN